jgi:Tfp pilus assembly protein PilV
MLARRCLVLHATPGMPARPRGSSLVEVIVALTVLTCGVLGLVGAAAVAQRAFAAAAATENAARLAASIVDSLLAEPAPAAGERVTRGVHAAWTIQPLQSALSAVAIEVEVVEAGRRRTVIYHAVHNATLLH